MSDCGWDAERGDFWIQRAPSSQMTWAGVTDVADCIIVGMSCTSVSSTILPLAGVVIGACGTLLGQHQALRIDARREAAKRALDQRTERKEAIIGFLGATERVEQHRGQFAIEPGHDAGNLNELMHAVWLTKKIIELVGSGAVAQAAQDYTLELNRAAKDLRPGGVGHPSPGLSIREQQLARSSWKPPGMNLAIQATLAAAHPQRSRHASSRQLGGYPELKSLTSSFMTKSTTRDRRRDPTAIRPILANMLLADSPLPEWCDMP